MEIGERISAIIVKDKKMMLVTGYDEKDAWTPGGKPDNDESELEALKREVKEELDVEVTNAKSYYNYEGKERNGQILPSNEHCYLVEYEGEPTPQKEITKVLWYDRADFLNKKPRVTKNIVKHLMPKLIKDGLL